METFLITAGLFVRTLFLIVPGFSKKDIWIIYLSVTMGFLVAGELEDMSFFPLGFILVIAIMYKDKILPSVTEGTLLLYGLVALFMFNQTHPLSHTLTTSDFLILIFLSIFSAFMFLLCLLKIRIRFSFQVFLVTLFLLVSTYIAYQGTISYLLYDTSMFAMFLIGFYGLHFISNIFYLLNFIPINGERQTYAMRLKEIKKHAQVLEKKYIDIDTYFIRTFGIIVLISFLFLYGHIYSDWLTGLTVALTLGSYIAASTNFEKLAHTH